MSPMPETPPPLPPSGGSQMIGQESIVSLSPNSPFQKLLHMLALTAERELTCEEVAELLDYYVELEEAGENVKALMPGLTQHLRICPECNEEYEALRRILHEDGGREEVD